VYFVFPYFYHDAFMHHPMHVLDAPDYNYTIYSFVISILELPKLSSTAR